MPALIRELYDDLYASGVWAEEQLDPQRIAKLRELRRLSGGFRGRVLDLGCGTGRMTVNLAAGAIEVVGLDISRIALRQASLNFIKTGVSKRIHLVLASADHLPFRDRVFDAVVAIDIIEHVYDDERCLKELSRALVPKGKLMMTLPHSRPLIKTQYDPRIGHLRAYSAVDVMRLLRECNFHVLRLRFWDALFSMFEYRLLEPLLKSLYYRSRSAMNDKYQLKTAIRGRATLKKFAAEALAILISLDKIFSNLPFGATILVLARKGKEPEKSTLHFR